MSTENEVFKVTVEDVEKCYGVDKNDLPADFLEKFSSLNLDYVKPSVEQRDKILLEVINKLDSDKQKIAAPERKDVWFKGWQENLDSFVKSNGDLTSLTPKFIRPDQPIRFQGNYIIPTNDQFEYDFLRLFQTWLFKKYLHDCKNIYEFGCGTGLNLELISSFFPDKNLWGLDFVQSAVDLIDKIGQYHNIKIKGHIFDMTTPDYDFKIASQSGVFTFGSIEQLGSDISGIIDYLLVSQPKICIHVEPTVELYDSSKLFDKLAIKFHQQRGYTEGLLGQLQSLEENEKIEILKVKRLNFGSLFMEGYSLIVWRPLQRQDKR